MYYLLVLALPLLLMGATYVDASYSPMERKEQSLEPSSFKLVPLESIKPQLMFDRFVHKPVFTCYPVDNLNKYMPGIDCTAGKPKFNL
jgi:hypothetical protein